MLGHKKQKHLGYLNFSPAKAMNVAQINPFPNDKILDTTKLKTIACDKLNIAKMMISL